MVHVPRLVAGLPSPNTTDTTETEARCESRCGDDSGSPALCRYFCANSEVQVLFSVQPHLQNLHYKHCKYVVFIYAHFEINLLPRQLNILTQNSA